VKQSRMQSDFLRQVAFVSFVDRRHLPGFTVLLKSLIRNSTKFVQDYIVLYHDLDDVEFTTIKDIYPKAILRKVDKSRYSGLFRSFPEIYAHRNAYYFLETFRIQGYRKLIFLDCDVVVLGDLSELFDLEGDFGAVEVLCDDADRSRFDRGLLVVDGRLCNGRFFDEVIAIGEAGSYEPDKHDLGIVNAGLRGDFVRIPWQYNAAAESLADAQDIPPDIKVLNFAGAAKPWADSAELPHPALVERWRKENVPLPDFWVASAEKYAKSGDADLAVYYAKRAAAAGGASVAKLRGALDILFRRGRFDDADPIVAQTAGDKGWKYFYNGKLAAARGEFTVAERLLAESLFREGVPVDKTLDALINTAWTINSLENARLYLEELRKRYPLSGPASSWEDKISLAEQHNRERANRTKPFFTHVAFYMTPRGNAGDLMLPDAVRRSFSLTFPGASFIPCHAHQNVGPQRLSEMAEGEAVIVGGGGLFLSDTAPNAQSGWQWNISLPALNQLSVPLIFFAVGYNRFKGQGEFSPIFEEHVRRCVEKSCFFGLRNHGSIDAIRSYLPEELWTRISYQPCPTTVARHLYPEEFSFPVERKYIAINIAYDRSESRFGNRYESFVAEVGAALRKIGKEAELRYVAHTRGDERFLFDLARQENIHLKSNRLFDASISEIIRFYRECKLVIGMRGHAGMIPFGCGTPILSLVTHPKLRYFLEDVGFPDWAIGIDGAFSETLYERTHEILKNFDVCRQNVERATDELLVVTQSNLTRIRQALMAAPRTGMLLS